MAVPFLFLDKGMLVLLFIVGVVAGVWRFIAFVEKLWFVRLRPALRGLKFIPFKKEIV